MANPKRWQPSRPLQELLQDHPNTPSLHLSPSRHSGKGLLEPPAPSPARSASTLGPEGASFLQLLQQQAEPGGSSGISLLRGFWGSWASPVQASGFPKMKNLGIQEDIFQSLKMYCSPPKLFYQRSLPKKSKNPHSPGVWPQRRLAQGARGARDCAHPSATLVPPQFPFFLTLSPPLRPPAPTQTVCTGSLPL